MKDIGHNEGIPADAAPTPTPEMPQLAQEFPAPMYMAKTFEDTTEPNERYVVSLYDSSGCLAHSIIITAVAAAYKQTQPGGAWHTAMAAAMTPATHPGPARGSAVVQSRPPRGGRSWCGVRPIAPAMPVVPDFIWFITYMKCYLGRDLNYSVL